jgi:hypothetical protein
MLRFFNRLVSVLIFPKREWDRIETERAPHMPFVYLITLVIITNVLEFIILLATGRTIYGMETIAQSGLILVALVVLQYMLCLLCAYVINVFSPIFEGNRNFVSALALVAYGMTPYFLAGLLSFEKALRPLSAVLSLYSLVLIWIGMPRVMHSPARTRPAFFIIAIVMTVLMYFVILLLGGFFILLTRL